MSGSYVDSAAEAMSADMAATVVEVSAAVAINADRQAQSAAFIAAHGAAVNGGHSPVGDVPPSLGGA
jgi:hypothetical protein